MGNLAEAAKTTSVVTVNVNQILLNQVGVQRLHLEPKATRAISKWLRSHQIQTRVVRTNKPLNRLFHHNCPKRYDETFLAKEL